MVKIGRTHFMDATPLTLGQEFSGYVSQLDHGLNALENTLPHLSELALGRNRGRNRLNTPKGYSKRVAEFIAKFTELPFISAPNKFEALAAHDAFVETTVPLKPWRFLLTRSLMISECWLPDREAELERSIFLQMSRDLLSCPEK